MEVGEQERHDLYTKAVSVFGRKEAAAMMSLLPPAGWADLATKTDLDHKIGVLEHKIEASEQRTAARIAQAEATLMKVIIGSVLATATAVAGIAFAAAGLT